VHQSVPFAFNVGVNRSTRTASRKPQIVHGKAIYYTNPWYSAKDDHPMASRNTSISLGDHMLSFAQQQVATGRYSSTSDVVRAGLRLLEDHESRVQALREALITGENSGFSTPFDFDSFIAARRAGRPPGDGQ
jgi:antitoxin ParD1/3/4